MMVDDAALARFVDASPNAMLVAARDGGIVMCNAAAGALFGRTPAELSASKVEDLMAPADRAAHRASRASYGTAPAPRAMGAGRLVRGLRNDGSEFVAEIGLAPVAPDRVLATVVDVSQSTREGERLREREELLQLFVDHAPAALAMFDREMRYIAVSRRWLDDYRLGSRNIVGRSHYEVFPELPERLRAVHRRCLAGAVERQDEAPFERADGTTQWLRWEALPWHTAAGDIGGILIFSEDITDRKLAQLERERLHAAVEQSEERFRATFEQAAVGIAHIAVDGAWLRVNRRLAGMTGREPDDLLVHPPAEIIFAEDAEHEAVQRARMVAGEIDHYGLPLRFVRANGDLRWVMLTMSLLRHADGRPGYFIAVVEDIDERRRAEHATRELRAEMDRLLAVNVASQTAMAVAHELNQPLNAVSSYAEAALRLLRAGNPKPDRLEHALESAAAQAQRAGRVVRELLRFLKKGVVEASVLDLNAIVRDSLAIVEGGGFGGCRTHLDLAPELRPVWANRAQVEKVLANLVRNGVESMHEAGVQPQRITISVTTAPDGDMALVTVADAGPGMDAATAARAFEPFFTTKPAGIGMGLAISRALIEANGGRLWIDENAKPRGATFRFSLPFAALDV